MIATQILHPGIARVFRELDLVERTLLVRPHLRSRSKAELAGVNCRRADKGRSFLSH